MSSAACTSGAQAMRKLPRITVRDLPEVLEVGTDYGMALLSARLKAARPALFASSPAGQAILTRCGFAPVGDPRGQPGSASS